MSLDGFITIDSSVDTSSSGLYVTGLPGVTIAQLDGLTRDEQADFEAFFATLYAAAQVNLKIDVQRALAQRFHIDKKQITRETSKYIGDLLDSTDPMGVKLEISLSKYSLIHLLTTEFFLDADIVPIRNCEIEWNTGTEFPVALGVTRGNGVFVLVGTDFVATSPDGITWTERVAANANDWYSVTYGNGRFVAIANSGAGERVMYSDDDGVTWTEAEAAVDNDWLTVKWIEGLALFVAVSSDSGNLDQVMTSYNGIDWVSQTTAQNSDWSDLAFGNGVLVAVSSAGLAMYSEDAITWTSVSGQVDSESIAFGAGVFVSSGAGGNSFKYSEDAITWTNGSLVGNAPADSLRFLFTGTYFMAVSTTFSAVSADGVTWYETTPIPGGGVQAIANSDALILLLSGDGFAKYGLPTSLLFDSVDVVVYDTDEDGDVLGTFTKSGITSGKNVVQINTYFDAEDLFVAFTPAGNLFRQTENKYFPTDSLSVDKLSCTFPCHFGEGSVTQVNGGGLNVKFNVVCSLDKFIEENINIFQYALWYRLGVDLMKERIVSDHVNRFVVLTAERAEELMRVYNEDYKAALDSATMNIRMNEDPICFTCKRPIKAVTSLP